MIGLVKGPSLLGDWSPIGIRPVWIERFVTGHPDLRMAPRLLPSPPEKAGDISTIVERLDPMDGRWWDEERVEKFNNSLSKIQADRLLGLIHSQGIHWRTAYRRTRAGVARWEVRADAISGCLRTSAGGSSKQALVEAGDGEMRIRWMTPKEYAALQGVPDFDLSGVSANKALYALGDAVCVNAVSWIGDNYLVPELATTTTEERSSTPVTSYA